jgi:hypothetical protein
VEVIERAYTEVEGEIGRLVSQHRAEWLPAVEGMIREDDDEIAILLDHLQAAVGRRQAHSGLHHWIAELPPSFQPQIFANNNISENVALGVLRSSLGNVVRKPDDEGEAVVRAVS